MEFLTCVNLIYAKCLLQYLAQSMCLVRVSYYYYCNYYYLNTIRITTIFCLGIMPRFFPEGWPAFSSHWDRGRSKALASWLGFCVYEVRISHGLIHNLRTFALVTPAWRSLDPSSMFCISQLWSLLWEELSFECLAKSSLQWLNDFIQELASVEGRLLSGAATSPQARFSQSDSPCLFPACAFKPKQPKECHFAKETQNLSRDCSLEGAFGMPGSWPKSWSEFITWSAAKEASTLMVGLWPWVLDVRCLEVLSSLLSCLLAFTSLVGLHFLNLPCSFSALSLYLENVPPLLLPYTLRLSPRKSLSWPQRLLEYSSFSTLYMSTSWCSSLWPSQPGSLSISPTGKWLSWSWDCVVCSWL